jgi:hypothetical protein
MADTREIFVENLENVPDRSSPEHFLERIFREICTGRRALSLYVAGNFPAEQAC